EVGERGSDLLAADELRDEVELLRADPQHAGNRLGFVVGKVALALLLAHDSCLTNSRPVPQPLQAPPPERRRARPNASLCDRTNGRRTCGSARTRRTCGRPFPR